MKYLEIFLTFLRLGLTSFGGPVAHLGYFQNEFVVRKKWITEESDADLVALCQFLPGPPFPLAGYLGAVSSRELSGWTGGVLALVSIFLPSFFLVIGILPFWESLRLISSIRYVVLGLNAGVVGILLAALYDPVWISAIHNSRDFGTAALGFVLLEYWKLPSWLVVLSIAVAA